MWPRKLLAFFLLARVPYWLLVRTPRYLSTNLPPIWVHSHLVPDILLHVQNSVFTLLERCQPIKIHWMTAWPSGESATLPFLCLLQIWWKYSISFLGLLIKLNMTCILIFCDTALNLRDSDWKKAFTCWTFLDCNQTQEN